MTKHHWRALLLLVSVSVVLGFTPACGRQPEFRPVATVKQLMVATVGPCSEAVFDSVGTIVSAAGIEEIAPKNDEEWAAVRNSALMLAESGNLLMMGGRAKDKRKWTELSQALIAAATAAFKAAEARNAPALLDAGGQVTDVCDRCHMLYRPEDRAISMLHLPTGGHRMTHDY